MTEDQMKFKRSPCSKMTVTAKDKIMISVAFFCRLVNCAVKNGNLDRLGKRDMIYKY